jgi:hypothetical protein
MHINSACICRSTWQQLPDNVDGTACRTYCTCRYSVTPRCPPAPYRQLIAWPSHYKRHQLPSLLWRYCVSSIPAAYLWDLCAFALAVEAPAVVAALQRAVTLNAALTEWRQPVQKSESGDTSDVCVRWVTPWLLAITELVAPATRLLKRARILTRAMRLQVPASTASTLHAAGHSYPAGICRLLL